MTKIYEGCGEYTIHLNSGKVVTLNEDEICEIGESTVAREDYDDQCSAINDIGDSLETLSSAVVEIKNILKFTTHIEQKALFEELVVIDSEMDDISNTVIVSKRQKIAQ